MIFHVFAALAEFERSLIRERTRAGLAAARARGRKGGRPRKLSPAQVRQAKAMLLDPEMTKSEVAPALPGDEDDLEQGIGDMKTLEQVRLDLHTGCFDFSRHALRRAMERNIREPEIRQAGRMAT